MVNFEYDMLFRENNFESALDKCIESALKNIYEEIDLIVFKHKVFSNMAIGFVSCDTTTCGEFIPFRELIIENNLREV